MTSTLDRLACAIDDVADLARRGHGDEPVAACEGWTFRDLVVHLGTVHRWAGAIVLSGGSVPDPSPRVPESPEGLADWYAGCGAALLAALAAVDPDEPVPNFSGTDQRAAFWPRRQLHETLVHRADARLALGDADPGAGIDPDVAADGVLEVLTTYAVRLTARGTPPVVTAPVLLRATDTGHAWLVEPGAGDAAPSVRVVDHDVAAPDRVEAGAVDLYLGVWHRIPAERLDVVGDAAASWLSGPTTT